jgi:DNA polymerase-4
VETREQEYHELPLHYAVDSLRKVIHIDMDAFFASVEQLDEPAYLGKPLIVAGSPEERGVVASASYEARVYGIRSAMSTRQALKLCPNAILCKPHFNRYQAISAAIHEIFYRYTDLIEPLSLDEAYLDVTHNHYNIPSATVIAQKILATIFNELGLTASAGVSYNKFLSKIASAYRKPKGLTVITPEEALDFIQNLPIQYFYGVGKVTEGKMLSAGIKTGGDLRRMPLEELIRLFGKMGMFYYEIARGYDPRAIESKRIRKSFGAEKTFQKDIMSLEELFIQIEQLAHRVDLLLKKNNSIGKTLTLKVRYADFTLLTRSCSKATGFAQQQEIAAAACQLLIERSLVKEPIRLLGITVSNLLASNYSAEDPCASLSAPLQLQLPLT